MRANKSLYRSSDCFLNSLAYVGIFVGRLGLVAALKCKVCNTVLVGDGF